MILISIVVHEPPPVEVFDVLDLSFAEVEIVPYFVDESLADHGAHVLRTVRLFLDLALEQGDAVRQVGVIFPAALEQWRVRI